MLGETNQMIWTIVGAAVVIGGALVLLYVNYYNRIQTLSNRIEEAWAQIDVQLQKRYDLVPNLVSTVKGYAEYEQETLTQVIEARSKATSVNKIGRAHV